jgi:hypothetical protein
MEKEDYTVFSTPVSMDPGYGKFADAKGIEADIGFSLEVGHELFKTLADLRKRQFSLVSPS